jgi:cupin 2 domain-containing protein
MPYSEIVQTLHVHGNVRIERILSHGQASPEGFWYDQEQAEWVTLLEGAATLRFEDEVVALKPGDHVYIPAHRKHRVDWTTPDAVWLAVHFEEQK